MKRKRLNNKGFTLIELLVAMTILSIITAMAIPLLRNLTDTVTNRKYETYKDSLVYASKLYVDSYSEDLFDNRESGCAYIDLDSLIERNFAKDIEIDNVSCKNSKTYIQVIKTGNEYTYTPYISCGTPRDNGTSEDNGYNYPEGDHIKDENACGFESAFNMYMYPSVTEVLSSTKKQEIELNIYSYTGISQNVEIYYAYATSQDISTVVTEWRKLTFKVPGIEKQKVKLQNGETVTVKSNTFTTPDDANQDLYLVIRVNNFYDLYGETWNKTGDKYTFYGPYRLDNSAPTFDYIEIYKLDNHWYHDIGVTDTANYERYYRMCPYADRGGVLVCQRKQDFTLAITNSNIIDDYISRYDDRDFFYTYCARIIDAAGNISEKGCSTKATYKIKMYANDGTNNYKIAKAEYSSRNDVVNNSTILATTPDRRPGYRFVKWTKDKAGKKNVSANAAFDDSYSKLYAQWEPLTYNVTIYDGDANGGTIVKTLGVDENMVLEPLPDTNTDKFYGYARYPGGGTAVLDYVVPEDSPKNISVTAAWIDRDYTITLTNLVGGNQTITYSSRTPGGVTLPTPTKSGYTFKGWTGEGYTTPTLNVNIPWGSWGDKTFKANWKKN